MRLFPNQQRMANYACSMKEGGEGSEGMGVDGQLFIRGSSTLEARSVRHQQPVHNGSRAFLASVQHLKHPRC